MRGSLQDQLLKAGLVKDKPATKAKKRPKSKANPAKSTKNRVAKENTQKQKPLADNELDKPVKLEIKSLLKENRINSKEGETPFNYAIGSQIKRCYITEAQLSKIHSGEVSIVNWNDRSYLIPSSLISQLKSLHPFLRFFSIEANDVQDKQEDEYKDHPIPDDLNW